jgi:TolA-binding protein
MSSAGGSGQGVKVAMLVVTILMLVAALAAAFFAGREYLGHVFLIPEELEARRTAEQAHSQQVDTLRERVGDLQDQIRGMEAERRRDAERAELERRRADEQVRVRREQARQAEIKKKRREHDQRERDQAARESQSRPAPPAGDGGDLRLGVAQGALRGFRISVNRQLNDEERRNYRARFVAGCGGNAVIFDAGQGFFIFSQSCQSWTFAGPEFVVERLDGE